MEYTEQVVQLLCSNKKTTVESINLSLTAFTMETDKELHHTVCRHDFKVSDVEIAKKLFSK